MIERPAPNAEGTFEKTPFAHVLVYARERSLTGTLAIQAAPDAGDLAGESLFALENGTVTQARLPLPMDTLGVVLREMNAIGDAHLQASLQQMAARRVLQGDALVAMGACPPAAIEQALRIQIRRKAIRLFGVRRASYQYFHGLDLLSGFGRERFAVDVFAVLWRGVRAHSNQPLLESVLERVGTQHLRLRSGADLRAFGFDRAEQGIIDVLRAGPGSLDALVRAAGDVRIGRAMVYVLLIARQLETVVPQQAPSVTAAPPAATKIPVATEPVAKAIEPATTPASTDSVPAEFRERFAEARARLAAMEDENYFQMLGVPVSAGADAVREAFLALAARWHPDRAPASAPALREVHAKIFAYLSEAQEALTHDELRAQYFTAVQEGGGTPNSQRRIGALIEAATDAQKAEVCLKRREYAEAERLARRALRVSPDDPNATFVLAAILAELRSEGAPDEAIKLLSRAVEIAPKHDRAHLLLGQLYKRRGDMARALQCFRSAVAANPKNVDASRELRLADMRARTGSHSPSDPGAADKPKEGLFSKLLKR